MTSRTLPASAVIATRHRPGPLRRTLESLAAQSAQPAEVVVVDASDDLLTEAALRSPVRGLASRIVRVRAAVAGAAAQRNEGVAAATRDAVWFMDDDILFEPECVARQFAALESDPRLGGVSAMITNQRYLPPGAIGRAFLAVLDGRARPTYAGRCLGPGWNLLPEDRDDLPEVVPVDWLNTTCTVYRRAALPEPPFEPFFHGYSLGEDAALSMRVAAGWKLANARTARIFHDSQPGDHKRDPAALAEMEAVNRYYLMTAVLGRRGLADHLRFAMLQAYQTAAVMAAEGGWKRLPAVLRGKFRGGRRILSGELRRGGVGGTSGARGRPQGGPSGAARGRAARHPEASDHRRARPRAGGPAARREAE